MYSPKKAGEIGGSETERSKRKYYSTLSDSRVVNIIN